MRPINVKRHLRKTKKGKVPVRKHKRTYSSYPVKRKVTEKQAEWARRQLSVAPLESGKDFNEKREIMARFADEKKLKSRNEVFMPELDPELTYGDIEDVIEEHQEWERKKLKKDDKKVMG